jgi:NAD(P)H-hydrate epimerase
MPGLTREQAREVDRRAVEEFGLPSVVLMENAGRGACDLLILLGIGGPVVICCGPGNNGGDGFVIARHLDLRRATVRVCVFAEPDRFTGDAAINLAVLRKTDVPIEFFGRTFDAARFEQSLQGAAFVVDALLGTGFQGEVREPISQAIYAINTSGVPVVAIDLPSGLDCDTGVPSRHTIRAQHTFTFVGPKRGFAAAGVRPFLGEVQVLDIGAPRKLTDEILGRMS